MLLSNNNKVTDLTVQETIYKHIMTKCKTEIQQCVFCRGSGMSQGSCCNVQAITLNSQLKEQFSKIGNQQMLQNANIMSEYSDIYWEVPYFNIWIYCKNCQRTRQLTVGWKKIMLPQEFNVLIENKQIGYLNRLHYGSPTILYQSS